MNILDVRDALLSVLDGVYHFVGPTDKTGHYVVWGETGITAVLNADDGTELLAPTGNIYYYTQDEYDTIFDDICEALDEYGVSWRVDSIGYDYETNQIVYELTWQVCCGNGKFYGGH